MTMRPLNECKRCNYTWHPRGKNLSLRCPNCGSRDVAISPIPVVGVLAVGGIVLLLAALGSGNRRDPEVARERRNEPVLAKTAETKSEPRADRSRPVVVPKPSPSAKTSEVPISVTPTKKTDPDPVALPPVLLPPVADPPKRDVAPLPRRVPLNRVPFMEPGAWVRRGDVQTRVLAVIVQKPKLTNDAGDEFPSTDPVCVIWVETQNLTAARLSLRRWINPANEFASLFVVGGERVSTAKFGRGARVGDQLVGEHKLIPGGPSVVDVLAFEYPFADKSLVLQLAGSHVGEGGKFIHPIPLEMWKKR
jgi:hypothetical protein